MVQQLDKIVLPTAPRPAKDPEDYRRSLENWTGEVEDTFRKFEVTVRALVEAVNQLSTK